MARDFSERATVITDDGVRLSAGVVRPEGEPRAVVLAGHAMAVNARSLDRPMGRGFASTLARRGILVVAADLRGHGQSGKPVSRGGDWSYDDLVLRDFPALLALARRLGPGLGCFVVGHSLMGHVAAAWLGRNPDAPEVRALVTLASNFWMKRFESRPLQRLRKARDIAGLRAFTGLFGALPARRFGLGTDDESARYMAQMLETYDRSAWRSTDLALDYRAGMAGLAVPMLAVVGRGETHWCTPESLEAFYRLAPQELITLWSVGRGDPPGLDFDPGHMELITDIRSAPLWEAIADWMLSQRRSI